MNIKSAKEEIKNTVRAYLARDDIGNFRISPIRQRPLLLMGPPGVGKTQIIEQVAQECGVALVAYTITHHTRQSAVGLPFIKEKTYAGRTRSVTEYTMSEIIASVYDKMEATGLKEGILFIDEINCVSETLAPTMLQFLQGKTFGNQKVPEGWIIVAAGNPPEYNRSVREFDVVTLDRIRRIDVEPDFAVWKEYAYRKSIHGAIISYLEIRRENFYRMETTPDGILFATPRGWEDLSEMIRVCEQLELPVGQELVLQYIQNPAVAKDFANYYELYKKYRNDYRVDEILDGHFSDEAVTKLRLAPFDEKLSVIGLLLSRLNDQFRQSYRIDQYTEELFGKLREWKEMLPGAMEAPDVLLQRLAQQMTDQLELRKENRQAGSEEEWVQLRCIRKLESYAKALQINEKREPDEAFAYVKEQFAQEPELRKKEISAASAALDHAFTFMATAFGESQEMVVFVTELTVNFYSSKFIADNGCDQYYVYNRGLLFAERQQGIMKEIDTLRAQENVDMLQEQ
ncbi:ATP-binding protein [Caproiciproducens sp. LBM24188]|nr:AAA family ATPase [Oscillospiraceae bacterium]HHV32820.1 AAA family ATPase [Clostridiales bacterium]